MMKRNIWTAETDNAIRAGYRLGGRGMLKRIAHQLGTTANAVECRARRIGAQKRMTIRYRPWSPEELAYIEDNIHLTAHQLQKRMRAKGWSRTSAAISEKRRTYMGGGDVVQETRSTHNILTANGLASALGVNSTSVSKWINSGWLKAKKTGNGKTQRWHIELRQAKEFITQFPQLVHFADHNKHWLIDILTS